MGHEMIEFVGVVVVISYLLEMSNGVIHDAARQRQHEKWEKECPLEAHSVNPWLVKIWDIDYGLTMSHGSIVAHRVVLSTCSDFTDAELRLTQYRLIGQNVLSVTATTKQCIQPRDVEQLVRHPECSRQEAHKGEPRSIHFVNLAVWIVKGHYNSAGDFPVLSFPRDRDTFLGDLRKLEAAPDNPGCILPVFTFRNEMDSSFPKDTKVRLIPYSTECVELICETAEDKEGCKTSNTPTKEGIRLCAVPKWTKTTPAFGEPDINWYNGSPLVCNGVAYGISTRIVSRSSDQHDFNLIMSFVEHTSWIKQMIDKFESLPSERAFHEEEADEETSRNPSKIPIDKNDYDEEEEIDEPQDARTNSRAAPNYYYPSSSTFSISVFIVSCLLC